MEWFESLYDDFRQRTGFGNLPPERTRADVDFIVDELSLPPGSKVLDLFSGTGRHSIELARRDIEAVGIELNPQYVSLAEQRAAEADVAPRFVTGDVLQVPLESGFDAAIIMWMSFGFFSDEDDRAVLRKVHAALKPGGRLLLELINRDYLVRCFRPRDEKIVDGIKVVEERVFDPLSSRIHSKIHREEASGTVTRETHWRAYSPHELKNILEDIGFQFVAGYGGPDRRPLDLVTRLMKLIFAK
jgi:cyclopropane fatty-acyl-phospholipid synthase-like methyltransferase